MKSNIITANEQLEAACGVLAGVERLAVDTEFVRKKTFYPELCLIQLGYEGGFFLVDAVAEIDLKPLWAVLNSGKSEKIFHSCQQDVEIVLHLSGSLPTPIFDTQVAAQFLGYDNSPSYELMAREFLSVELDKSCQFSDWKKRPLTDQQIEYAEAEVTHLLKLRGVIEERLDEVGKLIWFKEEMENLANQKNFEVDIERVIQRATPRNFPLAEKNIIAELVMWREKMAMEKDRPRQWILSDEEIIQIAKLKPETPEALKEGDVLAKGKLSKYWDALLGAVRLGLDRPLEDAKLKPLEAYDKAEFEGLKLKLAEIAEKHKIKPSLIATVSDLKAHLRNPATSLLHKGWRGEIFK